MISTDDTSSVKVTGMRFSSVIESEKRSSRRVTSVSASADFATGATSSVRPKSPAKISSCLLMAILIFARQLRQKQFVFVFHNQGAK